MCLGTIMLKAVIKNSVYRIKRLDDLLPRRATPYEGDVGFLLKPHRRTRKFTYANWGSRKWEYPYIIDQLEKIGIQDKKIVDLGIGLPDDSNFYQYYLRSGCYLTGYDIDARLPPELKLSDRCRILRKSSEHMEDFKDDEVDVAVALSSFEHFPIEVFRNTIKELSRVVKSGGDFLVTLDLTLDKERSAPYAILEKTLNGMPLQENNLRLSSNHRQLTIDYFLELVAPHFLPANPTIYGKESPISERVYSKEWNSQVAYLHLQKRI